MPDWVRLAPAVVLLAVILYVLLYLALSLQRSLRLNMMMRSLAHDMALHYTQTTFFRPPSVGGTYKRREVAFDVVGDDIRIRAFHSGEVASDFSAGTPDYFRRRGETAGLLKPSLRNQGFDERYLIAGENLAKISGYLDPYLQERLLASGTSLTVNKHYVWTTVSRSVADKARLAATVDVLVEAAAKADRLKF
jgi:hypothetical protein